MTNLPVITPETSHVTSDKGRFLSIALKEAKEGRLVFPCSGKDPLTEHGCIDATTDEAVIYQWAIKWPEANVGIAFRHDSTEVGIDVDVYEPSHADWLDRMQREHGILDTRVVKTGKGGFHYYYLRPPGITIPNVGKLAKRGFECKSNNQYLMAAGSVHPETRQEYVLVRDIDPQSLPVWLLAEIMKNESKATQITEPVPEGQGIPRGEHDAWLFSRARGYRAKGDTEDTILEKIKLDIQRLTDQDPARPYTDRDIRRIAHSASKYSVNPPTRLPDAPPDIKPSLVLPEIAWQGLFKDYLDMVGPTTEAADAFHYAAFLQVFGCTLGRRLHVYHAGRQFPNFYTCLVGRSGLTRKDTTWSRAEVVLNDLHAYPEDVDNPPFKSVRGLRSFEGLLDELAGDCKVRLIMLGELLSLFAKASQQSLGNIIPGLTEFYDMKDIVNPPVHQKDVKPAIEPFLSIMAGTTQDWLQKALTERDIYGGFANRWLYFYGLPKEPMPNPPKVDDEKRKKLVRELNQLRDWTESVPDGEISISKEASTLFENYYQSYYRRCQQPGLIPTLIVRIQDFIWKIALLYAADVMSETITGEHLETAIAVGYYLEASVAEVFANFGVSDSKTQETRLLEFLRNENGPVAEREVYRRLKVSAKELDTLVTPLIKIGVIKNSFQNTDKGRKIRTYEAV
jgi:hypothetical protein